MSWLAGIRSVESGLRPKITRLWLFDLLSARDRTSQLGLGSLANRLKKGHISEVEQDEGNYPNKVKKQNYSDLV
jgi:hypothetical protein